MKTRIASLLFVGGVMVLAACSTDRVTFLTRTTLSVAKVDSDPPQISVGFNRTEGMTGPVSPEGEVPEVFALMDANANLFHPVVDQFYATGDAALVLTKASVAPAPNTPPANAKAKQGREKKPPAMFYCMNSAVGLRIGYDPTTKIPNMLFGYEREEVSHIPLRSGSQKSMPSVLGVFKLNSNITAANPKGDMKIGAMFATGKAAQQSARMCAGDLKNSSLVSKDFSDFIAAYTSTNDKIYIMLNTYLALPDEKKNLVADKAVSLVMFSPEDTETLVGIPDDKPQEKRAKFEEFIQCHGLDVPSLSQKLDCLITYENSIK